MYYYIFDPPKNAAQRTYYSRIRDLAREFGIFGEITQSSPARSPEELVQIALEKNYSTIVAVGSDAHINKIASELIRRRSDFPVALGIVSMDPESLLAERFLFKTPETACETLKFRKLEKFDAGMIEPENYFLTSAVIEPSKPSRIVLEVDRWKAESVVDRLEISHNLYILLETYLRPTSKINSAVRWIMGKEIISVDRSIFKARLIKISSDVPLPVTIGGEIVAKTPVSVYRKPNALNVITKRGKITYEQMKSPDSQ